ncbi:GNAT family N-acetyltransferase [Rhizobiaceae bacterium n13]|uniref:GNAT family N-acetyltransferase n=1 Tax=Ferirhizobium litorale TaxID=2927786 RepID=A0AAE3QBY4_9HYPH|nr:GNAT family N-acetyltransferase [Fererhizobium litorale]MDI7861026.1 GNAT family N-acetyltransferase [Fererhizobium litorale]MDI7921173.1 GNAT family N-acetyltransferase [Fererhizobium litorale]
MPQIPTIETERLILRPHRLSDLEACVEMSKDEAVVRYISGVPLPKEQTWVRMLRWVGMWHYLGYGFLAVEEKETGRFIGEAGFQEMHRDMVPSIEGTLEAGWVLTPDVHGRGYATEALTALIAWAETHFPGKTMSCIIDPRNEPSLRVAAKLGFRELARTNYNGEVIVLSR